MLQRRDQVNVTISQLRDKVPAECQEHLKQLEAIVIESLGSTEKIEYLKKELLETKKDKDDITTNLKAQVIEYKEKAKHYKQRMVNQQEFHDKEWKDLLDEKVKAENAAYTTEMKNIAGANQSQKQEIEALQTEKAELAQRVADFENIVVDLRATKDEKINELETKLANIESKNSKEISRITKRKENIQHDLSVEKKEHEMIGLKLNQVILNNRKLMLQKKFLEKQLEKDAAEVNLEMNKIQISIQQEGANHMLSRFKSVYQSVSDQMSYVRQIVGFMDFDQEAVTASNVGTGSAVSYEEVVKELNDNVRRPGEPQVIHTEASGKSGSLTIDDCLSNYPFETLGVSFQVISEFLKELQVDQDEFMQRFTELLAGRSAGPVAAEIYERFIHKTKVHFQQKVHDMREQISSLESTNKNLKLKTQRHKMDMKRLSEGRTNGEIKKSQSVDYSAPGTRNDAVRRSSAERTHEAIEEEEQADFEVTQTEGEPTDRKGSKKGVDMDHERVNELLQLVDMLRQENVALKERCKEIRLSLQRKITELQDTLTISKQKYLTELSELKVQYGSDLNKITKTARQNLEIETKNILEAQKEDLDDLNKEHKEDLDKLREEITETKAKSQQTLEEADQRVKEAQKELKKLKKESTGYSQGGWGTFTVTFEVDNQPLEPTAKSRMVLSGKTRTLSNRTISEIDESKSQVSREEDINLPHPVEKVSHFIEVGFLIDQNNFRLINNLTETTFDSTLKKYLFELQDPLSNNQMNDLQFKIKTQFMENVGLFNELNPVYVSLNMGRPSTAFAEDYATQDKFKLIKREGLQLQERFLVVNFLKSDASETNGKVIGSELSIATSTPNDTVLEVRNQSDYILRVIAFEDATSAEFKLDLNFLDLLTITDGNVKLLEEENVNDLCQIVLSSLCFIKRERQGPAPVMKKNDDNNSQRKRISPYEDVLIVEHRIFFREDFKQQMDKKQQRIMTKYDKRRQGLVRDVELATEFTKSIIYEAFENVFEDSVRVGAETVDIEVVRGKMSGNVKLMVSASQNRITKELVLFSEEDQQSHKIASEIVHCPYGETLAYVFSIEKLYSLEETLVIRVVTIEKSDQAMSDYMYQPEQKPRDGSTKFWAETIYLVRKDNQNYCRMAQYEILNTELRSQLFMHSYGYIQSNSDFGNVRRYLEHGEQRRVNYLSVLGADEELENFNINISRPADEINYKGQNKLLYRQFATIRIRKILSAIQSTNRPETPVKTGNGSIAPTRMSGKAGTMDEEEIASGESRNRGSASRKASHGTTTRQMSAFKGQKQPQIDWTDSNYTGLLTVFEDGTCLEKQQLVIQVVIQSQDINILAHVDIDPEIISSQQLLSVLQGQEEIVEICEIIKDKIIILESFKQMPSLSELGEQMIIRELQLTLDKDVVPMSQLIAQDKQIRYEETLRNLEGRNDDSNIKRELPNVVPLKVPLETLAQAPKATQMTLINSKLYKINAYFLTNIRGFEPSVNESIFPWHFIYLEVSLRSMDQTHVTGVTEQDLFNLVIKLKQLLNSQGRQIEADRLLHKDMSEDEVLQLVIDSMLMDPVTFEIKMSMIHLEQCYRERKLLVDGFQITGGRYIEMPGGVDPELANLETTVPEQELTLRLLTNIQKDMSDKTFDVKIYELTLKACPGAKKFRFEIFWEDDPDLVFRCDLVSDENQEGSNMIIERINLIEQMLFQRLQRKQIKNDEYDPTKFAKDGLVLAMHQSSFPHQVSFMLIEPCSHIQWEFSYQDEKVNVIESRIQRRNFVSNMQSCLGEGILRDLADKDSVEFGQTGPQQVIEENLSKVVFYNISDLQQTFTNKLKKTEPLLIYSRSIQVAKGRFRILEIFSTDKELLTVRLSLPEDERTQLEAEETQALRQLRQSVEVQVKLGSQYEGSRIYSGCLAMLSNTTDLDGVPSHQKNLIFTIEMAQAMKVSQRAVRFTMYNQDIQAPILAVVFADQSLFPNQSLKQIDEQIQFAITSGFLDSLAVVRKISCLSYDYSRFEIEQEVRLKLEDNRSVDISRDYVDLLSESKSETKLSAVNDDPIAATNRSSNVLNMQTNANKERDKALIGLAKLKQSMMDNSIKNNTMLFRKCIVMDKGQRTIIVTVLREDNPFFDKDSKKKYNQFLLKLVLSETKRSDSRQEVQNSEDFSFVYEYDEVFSYEELRIEDLITLKVLKKTVAKAVNRRLRVRAVPDLLGVDNAPRMRYIAFFIDDKKPLPMDLTSKELNDMSQVKLGMKDFDIRTLHSFDLLDPQHKVLPTEDRELQEHAMIKQNLIYQFEKDDLFFDVFEIHNATELAFRFKLYKVDTFEMLTSCDIGEKAMKEQLSQDKCSFLSQPQQREKLARYVIDNSYYDEASRSLRFMVSDLIEDI